MLRTALSLYRVCRCSHLFLESRFILMQSLNERLSGDVLIMDGALGTQIQSLQLPTDAWCGFEGCNEYLNLTVPEAISGIHRAYIEAGADAIETNSFGASPATLSEYGLEKECARINAAAAACARRVADKLSTPDKPRYVFGSVGPGSRLPSLGQIDFAQLRDGYVTQIEALLEGGVDGILIETCQDMLQVKAAIVAFSELKGSASIPLYVSVTMEESGAMLVGTSIEAVAAILRPFDIAVLGLNCGTGPQAMRRHLSYLNSNRGGPIAAMPNAGLPELRDGELHYTLASDEFGRIMNDLVREVNLNIVGGCCGTTPEHIRSLTKALSGFSPTVRNRQPSDMAASLYGTVELDQIPPPLFIGERANASGSRAFRDKLAEGNYDAAFEVLAAQEQHGAHMLDLNCASPDGDEMADIKILVGRAARECRLPLMIDTTDEHVVAAALQRYGGRAFVNSINFEDGEERARRVARMAGRFGAGLVGLTIDEQGMAKTAERKLEVAERIVSICEQHCGIDRSAILIDPLTFTVASGDDGMRDSALHTLEAIRLIKDKIRGVRIMLGASNISFGLSPRAREVLNAVFLDMAVKAGLDAAIVNVSKLIPMADLDPHSIELARKLLHNDGSEGDPLLNFIEAFSGESASRRRTADKEVSDEQNLRDCIIRGRAISTELLERLLDRYSAEDILNDHLMPGMTEVGRLFNDGSLHLPFVLKSAEVMKKTVDHLKPHMHGSDGDSSQGKMVLATVAGDVHDVGKNLVDIILSNNGFDVVNLGTKITVEQLLDAVRECRPDAIGMSGLLVKSTAVMAENLRILKENGVDIPVFLGGAALTHSFVEQKCRPAYDGLCVYCADAFAGLNAFREFVDSGTIDIDSGRVAGAGRTVVGKPVSNPAVAIAVDQGAPNPPFWGSRIESRIDVRDLYPYINMRSLIRGRWSYRQGGKSDAEYEALLASEVYPRYEKLIADCEERDIFQPQAAWGYFECRSAGERLHVQRAGAEIVFDFPRIGDERVSIADYFSENGDVVAFMLVTMGKPYTLECSHLRADHEYEKYFLFHGLEAELTEALAQFWHKRIRAELGFPDPENIKPEDLFRKKYRGARYSFGYSACPDARMNAVCCELLEGHRIGVSVMDSGMMEPEVSTAAIIAHNQQADY